MPCGLIFGVYRGAPRPTPAAISRKILSRLSPCESFFPKDNAHGSIRETGVVSEAIWAVTLPVVAVEGALGGGGGGGRIPKPAKYAPRGGGAGAPRGGGGGGAG